MKTIKIKTKSLLYIVLFVAFILCARIFIAPQIMYGYASSLKAVGMVDKANAVYKKLASSFPQSKLSIDSLYNRCASQFIGASVGNADNGTTLLDFSGIYSEVSCFGSSTSGKVIREEDVESINKEYNELKTRFSDSSKKNSSLDKLHMVISLINWFGGEPKSALELMIKATHSVDTEIAEESTMYLAIMNMQLGNYDKSVELVSNQNFTSDELDTAKEKLLTTVDIIQNNDFKDEPVQPTSKQSTIVNLNNLTDLDVYNNMDRKKGNCTLSGNIYTSSGNINTASGAINASSVAITTSSETANASSDALAKTINSTLSPLSGLIVCMTEVVFIDNNGIGSSSKIDYLTTVERDGSFSFKNIKEGYYFISINAPWFLLKDTQVVYNGLTNDTRYIKIDKATKSNIAIALNTSFKANISPVKNNTVDVSWDSYPGAVSYSVNAGPIIKGGENCRDFFNATFSASTNGTHYKIDIKKYEAISSPFYSYGIYNNSSVGLLEPQYILGTFYVPGDYGVSVSACDKNGKIIASSTCTTTNKSPQKFHVTGCTTTTADNLLLQRKYVEAILQYKSDLEKNPKDSHSARMLATIYKVGYTNDGTKRDLDSALKYSLIWYSISPSPTITKNIADIYLEKGNISLAIQYFTELLDFEKIITLDDTEKNDGYLGLFEAYWYSGDFKRATEYFNKSRDLDISTYIDNKFYIMKILYGEPSAIDQIVNKSSINDKQISLVKNALSKIPYKSFTEFYQLLRNNNRLGASNWLDAHPQNEWTLFYRGILNMMIPEKDAAKHELQLTIQKINNLKTSNISDIKNISESLKLLDEGVRHLLYESSEK